MKEVRYKLLCLCRIAKLFLLEIYDYFLLWRMRRLLETGRRRLGTDASCIKEAEQELLGLEAQFNAFHFTSHSVRSLFGRDLFGRA